MTTNTSDCLESHTSDEFQAHRYCIRCFYDGLVFHSDTLIEHLIQTTNVNSLDVSFDLVLEHWNRELCSSTKPSCCIKWWVFARTTAIRVGTFFSNFGTSMTWTALWKVLIRLKSPSWMTVTSMTEQKLGQFTNFGTSMTWIALWNSIDTAENPSWMTGKSMTGQNLG